MKKVLFITILILALGLLVPSSAFAVATCGLNSNPETCDQIGLGEDMVLKVMAVDEDGYPLAGVAVAYTWTISTSNLGIFTSANSATCTGGEITTTQKCVETLNSSDAISSVNMRSSATVITGGQISVSASYGGITKTKQFVLTTACIAEPKLYYGIASIRNSGDSNWQSSTAEVLETCHPEYKLYEGIGEGG